MSNLYQASQQWQTRPDDERYSTLQELHTATAGHKASARVALVPWRDLRVTGTDGASANGQNLAIVGPTGATATLTHWSFGQLARTCGAPADYLRKLPQELACANVNHGLQLKEIDDKANLLLHANGSLVARAATSDEYGRIWNCDVTKRLLDFAGAGWRVPPARPARPGQRGTRKATAADVNTVRGSSGLTVNVGDDIAPAGLYASDHDMFAFLINEQNRINDGSADGLSRGFFVRNSEVGDGALVLTTFLYRTVCGNHIVWDASQVNELRVIHRGKAEERWNGSAIMAELRQYANASAYEDEAKIESAKRYSLGTDKETVLDALFTRLRGDLPKRTVELAYDRAVLDSDSDRTIDPRSAWGMTQGLTAVSQLTPYADERAKIDRAAGKVLSMAF